MVWGSRRGWEGLGRATRCRDGIVFGARFRSAAQRGVDGPHRLRSVPRMKTVRRPDFSQTCSLNRTFPIKVVVLSSDPTSSGLRGLLRTPFRPAMHSVWKRERVRLRSDCRAARLPVRDRLAKRRRRAPATCVPSLVLLSYCMLGLQSSRRSGIIARVWGADVCSQLQCGPAPPLP